MSIGSLFLYISLLFVLVEGAHRIAIFFQKDLSKWYRYYAFCALISSLFFAALARFSNTNVESSILLLLSAFFWIVTIRYIPKKERDHEKKSIWTKGAIFFALLAIVWGSWIRIAAVDQHSLQGDEYFHVNTGKGYLETGTFVQWDWLNDRPQEDKIYTRAWPYSFQVAQSIRFFGEEEWALRLPALVWGILLLILTPIVIGRVTGSAMIAIFTTFFLAFDSTMVWLSVFSRMYTMLFVLTLFSVYALWYGLYGNQSQTKKNQIIRFASLLIAALLLLIGYVIHPVSALLAPCFALIITIAWLQKRKDPFYRRIFFSMISAAALCCIALIFYPIENLHFIIIRDRLQTTYLEYVTLQMIVPSIAAALTVGALLSLFRFRKKCAPFLWISGAIVFPILLYFIVFANRYPAKKYFAFVLLFIYLLFSWILELIWKHLGIPKKYLLTLSTLFLLIVFIPFSVPGLSVPGIDTARADKTYLELTEHDYIAMYAFLEKEAPPQSAFVLQGTKQYYLTRKDVTLYPIRIQKKFTIEELKNIVNAHENGYILLSRPKKHLVSDDVIALIEKDFERVTFDGIKETNFILYRWSKGKEFQ